MTCNPSCYVCGHAPEEHGDGLLQSCEVEGCECICFEEAECVEACSLRRRLAIVAKLLEKGKTVQAYKIASDTRP